MFNLHLQVHCLNKVLYYNTIGLSNNGGCSQWNINVAPSLLVKEKLTGETECAMCCEGRVIVEVPGIMAPLVWILHVPGNMEYPKGIHSVMTYLALELFDIKPGKKISKSAFHALTTFKSNK